MAGIRREGIGASLVAISIRACSKYIISKPIIEPLEERTTCAKNCSKQVALYLISLNFWFYACSRIGTVP